MANASLACAAIVFGAYLLVVLAILRWVPHLEPALLVLAASLAVCTASLPLLGLFGHPVNFWLFMAGYWFLAAVFVMLFGAIYKSLSLRILSDLLDKPGYSDSYADVFARFVIKESYHARLSLIETKGFVRVRDGEFELTLAGRKLASRTRAVQQLFGIARSG
jgi:hypothetical protein